MGIEFRLDRSDHRVVERFLTSAPSRVRAIVVEATNLDRQHDAIATAKRHRVDVVVETMTERFAHPGLQRDGLDYFHGDVLDPITMRDGDRDEFVKRAVAFQLDTATVAVAPHFFADTAAMIDLNIDLIARTAALVDDHPVRAVLTAPRSLFRNVDPRTTAARMRLAGATAVDLRLSPLGGHRDGPNKILDAFEIAEAMRTAGLRVTFGLQGQLGLTALAMGCVDAFSVGIGYRENVDFKRVVASQAREPDPDAEFGSPAGIYLPGPGLTVRRKLGRALLEDTRLRGRLQADPMLLADPHGDPRRSYLTSRHQQVDDLLRRPQPWRVQHELDRLVRARELREIVNDYHLPEDQGPLPTVTIESLELLCSRHAEAA